MINYILFTTFYQIKRYIHTQNLETYSNVSYASIGNIVTCITYIMTNVSNNLNKDSIGTLR